MIPVLFSAALVGVLAVLGVLVAQLGWVALAAYLALVVVAAALAVRRQRAKPSDGRTCTCCTSTVFDPVEVR